MVRLLKTVQLQERLRVPWADDDLLLADSKLGENSLGPSRGSESHSLFLLV